MIAHRVLFDGSNSNSLLPLTYLRAVCDCRIGLLTIREKWEAWWPGQYEVHTAQYLQGLYSELNQGSSRIFINGAILPSPALIDDIQQLKIGELLLYQDEVVAVYLAEGDSIETLKYSTVSQDRIKRTQSPIKKITYPEDILSLAPDEFLNDFEILTRGKTSAPIPDHVKSRGEHIYIDPTAQVYDCILNASEGPIYIGPDSEVMEYAVIKGPVGLHSNCNIHVGAKVYANTYLGPYCKIGGEIKRTSIFGYSNKGHEGFLGDSILTEWCNLGADTNNSNLKNTYGDVSLWDIDQEQYRNTGRQFLGAILGDHTRCAINTAFMTGSVSGVFANVFGSINPPRYMPSFSWGTDHVYKIDKAIEIASKVMARRGIATSDSYIAAMKHLASLS